ncbi:uncharacterized protein LACBIDRAFT_334328 [Laccaria bicolor S238N-H82]|uniref:Predicted protein n=1 Tax=Laccaria bicolor (strain S238N-H82 / ATCC MYA-4686) TaxID=486041 RepID=B0DYV3_LACBS|nr:uncharacterized protein LACBIDRAFT_334328 [Laccaria bicolor S238N-H82]EDR00207.1 predicted protein [Laccaria bicolor S238N-H82]|eukprot:XP_001889116.1 predicted protein [Laccaria bicolor S238N-H82]
MTAHERPQHDNKPPPTTTNTHERNANANTKTNETATHPHGRQYSPPPMTDDDTHAPTTKTRAHARRILLTSTEMGNDEPRTYRIEYGFHLKKVWNPCEKVWNPSPIPWNPSPKVMESIPPFHGIHLEFLQSTPHSMDSTWNNLGRVKYKVLRNWAMGQYYNPVDDEELHISSNVEKVKGIVKIYVSPLDPVELDFTKMQPSLKVPVTVNLNLGPVLKEVAVRWPPITRNHILVYDALDGLWVAEGIYDSAVEINDSILFDNSDGKATLHILVSSFESGISLSSIAPSRAHSLQGGSIPSMSHSSTPIRSHSRTHSISTSEDIQSGSIEPSTADAEDSVGQTSFTAYEMSLLHILKVPMNLTLTKALNNMRQVKQWPEKTPTEKEVTELFIGKASGAMFGVQPSVEFYSTFQKCKDAEELWGIDAKYTLKMLKEWMDQGGKPLKGKARVVEEAVAESSSKGLGKEKDKDKKKKKKKKKSEKSDEYLVKPHVMIVSTLVWLLLCLALQLFISVTGPTAAGFINVIFLAGFSLKCYTLATSPISWLLVWLAFVPCF